MKNQVIRFLLCLVVGVIVMNCANADTDMRIQMLDAQIERLERERTSRLADLQDCEKKTNGFKIAGLSTLALTGIGVYAYVKLNEKLKNQGSNYHGPRGNSNIIDARSQDDKDCASVRELFELGLATQEEVDETCKK